jgi:hypothetical protein
MLREAKPLEGYKMNPKTQHAELNELKWDARAATYDQKRFDYFRWMQRRVIGLIDLRPGLHFLGHICSFLFYEFTYLGREVQLSFYPNFVS